MYVRSYLHNFHMYGSEILCASPEVYGDGPYSKTKNSRGGGDVTKESMWTFDVDYVTQYNRSL